MPRFSFNACALLVAATVTFVGCAKPTETTPPTAPEGAHTDAQSSSTAGPAMEVPMTEEKPAEPTPATETPAPAAETPAPAEAAPAADKPAAE